jgi:integrase
MAEALYGQLLADDEAWRFGGRAYVARTLELIRHEKPDFEPPYPIESIPEHGWTPENLALQKENMVHELATMQEALALGDITAVVDDVSLLLADFQINLDRNSTSYRELAMQALRAYVRALQAIEKRNAGEPIETPKFTRGPTGSSAAGGGTIREALTGWQKDRRRPPGTVHEYTRAVEMFVQLHGDLPVADIKRSHARAFKEALQSVPRTRKGSLLGATLPELVEWGRKHPQAPKVSAGTVNKQLGGLAAIASWADQNGLIPEDAAWSNPFATIKVPVERSERTSFETAELQRLFASAVFTKHEYPQGARGPAAFWLPLMALFTGARQAELAGLTVENVQTDEQTSTPLLYITTQASRGKRLKTTSSQRVIAVHPQLAKLGFLRYVDDVRRRQGAAAWLFPLIAPDKGRSGVGAWSKWFGRYLRKQVGITDTAKVFHSFRHSANDALRRGRVDEELRRALVGHAHPSRVDYGAKQMLARWGAAALTDAVAKISFPGLDLSRVRPFAVRKPTRGKK